MRIGCINPLLNIFSKKLFIFKVYKIIYIKWGLKLLNTQYYSLKIYFIGENILNINYFCFQRIKYFFKHYFLIFLKNVQFTFLNFLNVSRRLINIFHINYLINFNFLI